MRVAIHPKLARKSSDYFWREVHKLCSQRVGDRRAALQKWIEEPFKQNVAADDPQQALRAAAIKRFSFIFDRHFAVSRSIPSEEVPAEPHAASASEFAPSSTHAEQINSVEGDQTSSLAGPESTSQHKKATANVEAVSNSERMPKKRQR